MADKFLQLCIGLGAVLAVLCGPPATAVAAGAQADTEGSVFGKYLAGRHAHRNNDTQAASRYYAEVLAEDPDSELLLHPAFIVTLAVGQIDDSVPLAKKLLRTQKRDVLGNLVLTLQAVMAGDFAAAEKQLSKASRRRSGALLVPLVKAWTLAGNQPDKALAALAPLKKKKKFRLFEAYHRGLINDLAGRPEAADAAFREVTAKQDFRSLRVVEAYGGFLARQGRFDEATALFRSFLDEIRDPDNPLILEALQRSEKKRAPEPLVPDVRSGLAEVFYGAAAAAAQGQTREVAKVYVQLAIHLKPHSAVALTLLGGLLDQDERTAEANDVYARIEGQTAYGWRARIRMADNLNRLDKIEAAGKLLRAMAAERPQRIDALVALGDILRGHERYTESASVYDQAIARVGEPQSKHWTLFYARGISRERTERWPEAERDFLTSLELKPDQALVLNYLGYSWIDRGEHLDKARKLIERAVELRPRDGYIIDSLGWVLYRLGEFEGAVKQLERAVSLRPQDPIINDHLGDAYWRAGRRLEAVFQWRHALVLNPDKDVIPVIQKKLQQGLKDKPKPDLQPGDKGATGN